MRNLVALAVIGVCFASCQAGNIGYGSYGHAGAYGNTGAYQPRWTGPVAATVPAGIGGKIIPVSDTYEVAAARKAFFQAYDDQLAKVGGLRYGASHYSGPHGYGGPSHGPAHAFGGPGYYGAAAHGYGGVSHGPVRDTPEVAAAKAQFFTLYNKQAAAAAAAPDHYTYHSKPHHY